MRLPGRHVLYALSAVTMLAACSSNGARGGIASTNMNPTNPPATAETATVSPTPAPQSARTETWINLQVGDCLADLPPADLSRITVTIVDCATAHSAEVYLRAPVAVDAAVVSMANRALLSWISSRSPPRTDRHRSAVEKDARRRPGCAHRPIGLAHPIPKTHPRTPSGALVGFRKLTRAITARFGKRWDRTISTLHRPKALPSTE